ncbi:MAG TPA: carboxypeptidase-like regulatory domain-containing protein [Thermoanaerobaculia bacterium]|nr:carboxypeptidase-like regulatory domain-containing protein [Thermoanaerobaculia bacterium]
MRVPACLAIFVLVLAFPAFGVDTEGIPVGGQVLGPSKEACAVLVPILSEVEAGRLELEGKTFPEPVASVAVAADGSFRLEAPGPGMWKVVVEAPGFVPWEVLLAPLVEEIELQPVELEKDARLEVRLRGPDGRPVAGARVRAVSVASPSGRQDKWRRPVGTALTDLQGLAVLPRGSAEALTVRAGMAGLPFVEKREVRTSSLSLSLSAGQTRELRVLDSRGKPVAGALVRLGEARWAGGLTSEEGLFSVPLAGNQKVRVSASAGDGRSSSAYLEPAKPTETGPRELRLPAVEALAGRVVSTVDGRPVVGALVWAGDLGVFQRTGGDGGYKLPGVAGRELVVLAAAASFFQARESWPVRPGERRAPTLALEPAQAAAGIVVDEQGKPVAGVEIQAKIQPGSRIRTPGRWGSGANARTTAAGRFRIPGLAAGIAHELQLARRGYAPAKADAPPAAPGKVAAELRIVLRRGRTAFGRVVNHAEQPVAGAKVSLEADDSGPGYFFSDESETFDATADAGGRFEVPDLSPGAYKLTARGAGYAPITVPGLTVPEGGGATDLGTVVLVKGAALEGYVADLAGKPLEGAQVFVFEASSDPTINFGRKEEPPAAISEKDGFFRVEDRRAGETVDLEVRRSGYARGEAPRVEVPPQEPVRIALKPSSVVEGRTADPDGKPVAGALVLLNPAGPSKVGRGVIYFTSANSKEVQSGDDGSFRIEDVAPGTYELKSFASGRQSAEMSNLEVVVGQDLKGVEVVLQPGAVIEGRVLSQ